jgi:hypothetical protein
VLTWNAFARPLPLEQQTWMLSVARERVVWQRTHALHVEEHEFTASTWARPEAPVATSRAASRRARP